MDLRDPSDQREKPRDTRNCFSALAGEEPRHLFRRRGTGEEVTRLRIELGLEPGVGIGVGFTVGDALGVGTGVSAAQCPGAGRVSWARSAARSGSWLFW